MASFIDDIFQKLFPQKKEPLKVKENFIQSDSEKADIRNWIQSEEFSQLIDLIHQNYQLKKAGVQKSPEVHILNSPYANGFAVTFEPPFTEKLFSQLFFAFGERISDLGYVKVSLDRKTEEIQEDVKITDKQYFKPPLKSVQKYQKIDQLYGNVSVEKVSVNHKSSHLKVLVTIYSDHLYQKALPFDQFIEHLFQS